MELAIFGDVLDVLDDLCRVLRARLAKLEVSNPPCGSPRVTSSSSSSGTASVVRDQGPAVLRHLDWVSSSLSIVLNTTNSADGGGGSGGGDASVAPAIRSLLTRKLGDVMESAHQLRPITQDSCEMSASFSTTTNSLKSSFNSSVNVSPVDEQLRAKQIFRTASQNLEDAQRLLRISYPQLLSTAALSAASESRANGYNNTTVGHHAKGEQKPHHSPHIYSPAVPFEAPVLCISPRPGAAEEYDDEYNDCSAPRYSTNTAPYVNRSQSREYSNLRDESSLEPWHQPDTPTDDVISALELDQTARYQEPASSERRGMLETLPSSISQPPAPPAPKPSQRKPPLPLSPSSRKAASSLPPRSPNAQSLKPTVDDDDENDDASGLQTSPHVHRMTGVLWKEILADSRDVLDGTFVKDMLELFNYGETEPQIRKEDVRSLRFSFADNSTLYIRFMLRHRPTLSASDVDLRISLYAFPGMMAMYEERKRLQARQYDDRENHRDNYALRDDLATATLTGGDGSLSTTVYSDDRALTMSPDVKAAGDMMALAQSSAMPHASSSNTMMSDRSQSSMVPLQGYSFPPGSHYYQVSIPGEHWGAVLPHMTEQTCRSLLIEEVSTLLDVPRGSVEKVVFQLGSLIVGFSIYPPAGGPSRSDIEVALKAFDFPAVRSAYDAACQELRLEKRAVVPEGSPLERMPTGDSQDQRTGAVVRLILPDRGALDCSDDEDITVSSMVLSALSPTMSPTISRATPTLSCNGSSHFSNCVVAVPPARFLAEEKSALAADEKSLMPTHALVAPSPSSSTHMVSPLLATTRTAQAPRSEQKPRPDDVTSPTQKLSPKVITSESASAAPTATLKATAAPVPSVKAEPAPAAKSTPVPTAKAVPKAATLAVAPAQRQPVQATRDKKEEMQKTQQEGQQQQIGEQFARNDSAAPREWQPKPLPRHNSARPRTADRLAASARPATSSSAAVAVSGSARAAGQPVPSTRHPKPIAASNLRGVKGAATGSVVSSARGTRKEPIAQEQPPAVMVEDKSALAAPEATPSSKQEPTTAVPQKHQDPSAKAQTAVVDKKNTPTQSKTNTPGVQTDAKTSSPVVSVSAPIRVESQEAEWAIPEVQPSATSRGEAPEGNSNSRSTGLVVDEGTLTVSRVKGAAARDAGFCPGDTLRTVDGKKITTASDFFAYMASSNRPVAFVTVETSSGAVATRRMVPTRRGDGYQREASASQPAAHRSATGGLLLSDPRRPTHSVPASNNSVAAGSTSSISPQRVDAAAEETRPPQERTRINPHRIASTSTQSSARDGVSRSASARYNNNNNRLTRTGSPSTQSHHVQDSVKASSGNLRGTSQYSAVQSRKI